MTKTLHWVALPHCPANQLQKPTSEKDAGWDIRIAETVWVKPYSDRPFTWEDIGMQSELKDEIPELFKPESYSVFVTQDGVRLKDKYIVAFDTEKEGSLKQKLTLACQDVKLHEPGKLLVDGDCGSIRQIVGEKTRVEQVNVLQRKKYKPTLIKTGIKLQPDSLFWNAIYLRSSMSKYALSMAHAVGVIDCLYENEVFVPVYPIEGQTVLRRGDRIAQLVPTQQFSPEQLKLQQISENAFSSTGREGLGSSGTGG